MAAAAVVMMLNSSPAHAQQTRRQFKDKIHVRQPKPVLSKGRVEIAPHVGASFNDALYQSVRAGLNLNYHIAESFYLGGLFHWYNFGNVLGGETRAYEQTQQQTSARSDAPALNFAGGLEVGWVPIFGKFALFNSDIVYYDAAINAGAVYVDRRSIQSLSTGRSFGGTVGLTMHVFVNEWMSFNMEVRDTIFFAPLSGAQEEVLSHVATASLGVGFFLPTQVERAKSLNEPEEEE